jgi:hypothetical protein
LFCRLAGGDGLVKQTESPKIKLFTVSLLTLYFPLGFCLMPVSPAAAAFGYVPVAASSPTRNFPG